MTANKSVKEILAGVFRHVGELFEELETPAVDRAVSTQDIWTFVQNQLNGPADETGAIAADNGFVIDVFVDSAGTFAVVTKSDGKLYKVPVTVGEDSSITTGEHQEVLMEFSPVTPRQLRVHRTADGKMRWLAMPACTAALNRVGEIDSTKLFNDFVDHIERTGEYPELDFFHFGERCVLGKADLVFRDGVAYCATGTFYDTEIARAAAATLESDADYWGLSIAYLPTKEPEMIRSKDGIQIPVYNYGVNRFISLLPESTAASILTSIRTQAQENNRMNQTQEEALTRLCGGDKKLIEDIREKLNSVNRQAAGMITRNDTTPATTTVETHVVETSTPVQPASAAPTTEQRAVTADDLIAILAAPEFEARVKEIIAAVQAGDMVEQSNPQATTTPVTPTAPAVSPELEALRTALGDLTKTVNGMSAQITGLVQERQQERDVMKDMPSRIKRETIVRPRTTVERTQERVKTDLAALAEQTLAQMAPG